MRAPEEGLTAVTAAGPESSEKGEVGAGDWNLLLEGLEAGAGASGLPWGLLPSPSPLPAAPHLHPLSLPCPPGTPPWPHVAWPVPTELRGACPALDSPPTPRPVWGDVTGPGDGLWAVPTPLA